MNEFELYELLCMADEVAVQYPSAASLRQRIEHAKDMFSEKKYRLAVVGEFKRGKSSLINALVGNKLLPTDICPTTAVIGRLVYGEDKKIIICYKNGRIEEKTTDELWKYATKLERGGEENAALIKEIIIKCPSIFCRNGIEIIDTPGLNDNEQMSETTLKILDSVDSVIIAISAVIPLSMTERELIMTLLEQDGIRHITFVITFIDRVSDERSEQDRLIEFTRNRIKNDVLEEARKRFSDRAELIAKAESWLEAPVLFAVSSKLAMKGFDSDNQELLKESRFPEFKQSLLELLISGLDTDRRIVTKSCICDLSDRLDYFYKQSIKNAEERFRKRQENMDLVREYYTDTKQWIISEMEALDIRLKQKGFYPESGLCDTWLEQLSEIIQNIYSSKMHNENIEGDMSERIMSAGRCVNYIMLQRSVYYERWIQEEIRILYSKFHKKRLDAGLDSSEFDENIHNLRKICPFPEYELSEDADVKTAIEGIKRFGRRISKYIAQWRGMAARQYIQDCAAWGSIEDPDTQKKYLQCNYVKNKQCMEKCRLRLEGLI